MKIFFLSTRDARISRTTDSGQLEFSRLLIASSTVIMPIVVRAFPGCLTCAAHTLTLAHQPMSCFPYGTLAEICGEIRSKNVSPVELVGLHLKRIETLQPKLNAFVHLDPEGALQQARAAEFSVARGAQLGPLHGVPLTMKSCIDVAGWPCPAGSLLRKNYVPKQDAPLVLRLKSAGAILLGNTNTPEFLMAYETDNRITGKTSNPWNLARSGGGSSGGEAAAIAAGCSAGGVGSDGGGSIRVPAHFCGICGLKPTPGGVPATGHFPPGAGAALSAPVPLRAYRQGELRGLRIGILESDALGIATAETRAAVERAAKSLGEQGFAVEPFRLDSLYREVDLWLLFF